MCEIMNDEQLIISLTTWSARIHNIPVVLDTIFAQSIQPDLVVLNLAYEEVIPEDVHSYLRNHNVQINRVEDTKVYKKLLPTLKLYPDACVISIDDDFYYTPSMIEDFLRLHRRFPNNPISGNNTEYKYINCHCGCASLTKREYWGDCLDMIDDDVINNCPSDDLVYTFFMAKSGRKYKRTKQLYFENLPPINPAEPYSASLDYPLERTWDYLTKRFGNVINDNCIDVFFKKVRNVIKRLAR